MAATFRLGYWLSSEEHDAQRLTRLAAEAEQCGFSAAVISDHFHPWIPDQGQSPFVWTVLGAISQVTTSLRIGTGVTAPIMRTHPAVVAQAAATTATLLPDRFFLGLGTGERLNEQVTGDRWPPPSERRDMLAEAVEIIRRLLDGEEVTCRSPHFAVEHAQIYSRPDRPPPLYLAGSSKAGAELAGRIGDGFVGVKASSAHIDAFEGAGGAGKARLGQVHVCWAPTRTEAIELAHHWWPNAAIAPGLLTELARPAHFAQAARSVSTDDVAAKVVCGPDPQDHVDAIATFAKAGFTEVYVHQVGPNQEGFFDFYRREILPMFSYDGAHILKGLTS